MVNSKNYFSSITLLDSYSILYIYQIEFDKLFNLNQLINQFIY